MKKFGKGLHQNKNMIFINKKVAAVLLSLVVFTIPCYANETQCTILNATAEEDSDTIYFPKFLSFEAKSDRRRSISSKPLSLCIRRWYDNGTFKRFV